MLSRNPIPNGIQKMIALGRYEEAATALTKLAAERPSLAGLVALASVNLQLGDLARLAVAGCCFRSPHRLVLGGREITELQIDRCQRDKTR